MRYLPTIAVIMLLTICSPAHSFTKTAAEFLSICNKGQTEVMVCTAFVIGVAYGFEDAREHIRLTTNLKTAPDLFCVPDNWSAGQGLEVVINWASENPEFLEHSPSSVVLWAHREAYPCD